MTPPARRSVGRVLILEKQNLGKEYHIKLRHMFSEPYTTPSLKDYGPL